MTHLDCDILVVGGGCGGVAAALAAASLGRDVILTEESDWVGGQLTTQAVPPDEHPWVEQTGVTATYRRFREGVRAHYRAHRALTDAARRDPRLNPGQGWVSALCHEPVVAHAMLSAMLDAHGDRIRVLRRHEPRAADVTGDTIHAVEFLARDGDAAPVVVTAAHVLDATEEGDLLPLTGCEHVLGAESADETGEPHALPGPGDPMDQQAITWCAALEWRPGEDHTIDRPARYGFWREYRSAFWPGPHLGWTTQEPETGRPLTRPLFASDVPDLWTFRRIRYGGHYRDPVTDITLVNWPQADYWLGPITGVSPAARAEHLAAARELTRCLVHWLQTDAPRPDGGTGYPGLRLAGDVLGTEDGLARRPYIRESRRIRAEFTVLEQHVGVAARGDRRGAEWFPDAVGIGSYRIDLHPSTGGRGYIDIATWPFQIPLGALLPVRLDNLIAAGKCLGTTHVTNGCYRLHPVEWNVGEAAGALAAFALEHRVPPRAVRASEELLTRFQATLRDTLGIPLAWPDDIREVPR